MIEEIAEALEALKEYCLHTACCDCMLYKPETGCFFKYHSYGNTITPSEWDIDAIFPDDDY